MKNNNKIAGRYVRKSRYARTLRLDSVIERRPFDPVAYAAALEVLG